MAVALVPPGVAGATDAVLQSFYDAIRALQNPGAPTNLASVDLIADLTTYPASDWPNGALICAEINSIVVSTLVAGTWTWLRADGSAI